jgi:hypothetical protein
MELARKTRHAQRRCKDRGIPEIGIELVQQFGVSRPAGHGAQSYSFDKSGWKNLESYVGHWQLKTMDRLKKLYIVVSDSGEIITAAFRK